MSVQTKNKLTVWSKKLGVLLFAVLFLLNIKVALMGESSDGNISLFGLKITLFESTLAAEQPGGSPCLPAGCLIDISVGCQHIQGSVICLYCGIYCENGYEGVASILCESLPC